MKDDRTALIYQQLLELKSMSATLRALISAVWPASPGAADCFKDCLPACLSVSTTDGKGWTTAVLDDGGFLV